MSDTASDMPTPSLLAALPVQDTEATTSTFEQMNAARHTPEAIAASLAEVDEILVQALHEAWLRAHVARYEKAARAMRSMPAYQRANTAKHQLDAVWQTLGLPGKISDVPQRLAS